VCFRASKAAGWAFAGPPDNVYANLLVAGQFEFLESDGRAQQSHAAALSCYL
jgi:hypothetical protein